VGLPGNKGGVNSKIRVYEANTNHLLWFEEVMMFSKQAQQNYYAFDQLERHYGLGTKDHVDVTVTFYPSGTVVRSNGVAANSTIVIGEDGTNGIVVPPSAAMPPDASLPDVGSPQDGSPQDDSGGPSQIDSGGASNGDSGAGLNANAPSVAGRAGGCSCRIGAASKSDQGRRTGGELLFAILTLLCMRGRINGFSRRR
jgi:hypothetical protein